jgi:hypothetical protein
LENHLISLRRRRIALAKKNPSTALKHYSIRFRSYPAFIQVSKTFLKYMSQSVWMHG